MATLTITNTLVAGAKVKASDHNTNYSDISTWLNNLYNGTTTWTVTKSTQMYFGAGTAALPGVSIIGDTTTGLHQVSAGVLGVSLSGVKSADFFSTGSTNATTYTPVRIFAHAKPKDLETQRTTGCSTSATAIHTLQLDAAVVMVYGKQTAGGTTEFFDLVMFAASAATADVIKQHAAAGVADTRTYSVSGSNLRVAMGGNTYSIGTYALGLTGG